MARRQSFARRWLTAASWPAGIALTSWDYMWRSTVLHRLEALEAAPEGHLPPPFPADVDDSDVVLVDEGHGPLFHRRYATLIREADLDANELFARLTSDLNRASPAKFARFQRLLGDPGCMALGDEYVVRMPGPWDGPVRVIERQPRSFRLATLTGHLEAGQIEFRVEQDHCLRFQIESWARSSTRLSNLLYHRMRMAKEVQLHMWISFLERVVDLSGGRMTGGIEVDTRRIEAGFSR
jgi:hypothetical protein